MDTNELTVALREATDGVEPRPTFAADVLRGGRRRRSRNRLTIGAAVAGTAAVAVVAATVLPNHLASPPPPADQPTEFSLLDRSGGYLIADEAVTRAALAGWTDGIAGNVGKAAGISPADLRGEPHVYWAGSTSSMTAAIVAQEMTLSDGTRAVASGAVADNPDDDRPNELELVGATSTTAAFLLPDNTLLAPFPDGDQTLFVSTNITVNDEGRSVRREWRAFDNYDDDTAKIIDLPDLSSPHNLRIAIGATDGRDGYLPVELLPNTPEIQDRGDPWPAETRHIPEPRDLPRPAWEIFRDGLRDSGLLDLTSYAAGEPQWTVVADLPDGRTLIISEHQELDNPAWMFSVLMRPDNSVENVARVGEIDPAAGAWLLLPAPDRQGWVVVNARGEQIAYRTSAEGSWTNLGTGAALVPADGVEIKLDDAVHYLAAN
jgi:hypothetical protein